MKHIADIEWRAGLTLREISRMAPEVLRDHFQAWSKRNAPHSAQYRELFDRTIAGSDAL